MTVKELLRRIKYALSHKPKTLKCYSDENFLYCWCGKCKPKEYELPADFKRLIAISATENYKKSRSSLK